MQQEKLDKYGVNKTSARGMKPLKSSPSSRDICAFDIETKGDTNEFVLGSIAWYDKGQNQYDETNIDYEVFRDKIDMIEFIRNDDHKFYKNSVIFATNLHFDILALFENTKYFNDLRFMFRDSRLLMSKLLNEDFKDRGRYSVTFYDSLNHFRGSVKQMGEMIDFPKFEKPSFLGEKPKSKEEWKILEDYNVRDTLVTLKFMKWWQKMYNNIGCNLKVTLPSTSLDLFKRKYLNQKIKQPERRIMRKLYNAYYGGRTEAIKRGRIENCRLYDINSLYPAVMMLNKFPNPNNCYYREYKGDEKTDFYTIHNTMGVSYVEMYCPENINIPYLPVRTDNKLLFPCGYIKGWFTHYEIKEAIKLGYDLLKVHESVSYPQSHEPFKDFVKDMYNQRLKNKKNPKELTYKLLMNSLYGKFAQRMKPQDSIRHIDSFDKTEFIKLWKNPNINMRVINDFVFFRKEKMKRIPRYINPIYSIYTTAYARDLLYKTMPDDVYYMDTDSAITKEKMDTGKMLGEWDLENEIDEGLIVKPKFYYVDDKAKVKGCSGISVRDVKRLIQNRRYSESKKEIVGDKYEYEKLSKFRESIRREKSFNEKMIMEKRMSLEDDKREWEKEFNPNELQKSKPRKLLRENYA